MSTPTSAPHVVTLGTAGGPRWWRDGAQQRAGIATAVVVGDAAYLVDAGHGAAAQLAKAGIAIDDLRGIFLTHLHSDHVVDLASLTIFGFLNVKDQQREPIRVLGPGNRGILPPTAPSATAPVEALFPENPTRGTAEMIDCLFQAFSTDVADRMFDALRPSPYRIFQAEDITIPHGCGYHPNTNSTPADLEPFVVYRDELVTVTATLVQHPPVAPAFAFRFDTAHGSVTISGDTAPCSNLVRLAEGTDLLLHEAIDLDWAVRGYAGEQAETAAATIEHHRRAHTTPEQAGEVAALAGASALALHHLVPGNADPQVWRRAEQTFSGPVLVPDDLDRIGFATSRTHQASGLLSTRN